MPTVLRAEGFRFFFFSNESQEPPHVHIEYGNKVAKYWLDPVELASNQGFRAHELGRLRALVAQHRATFRKAWHDHFGS